MTADKELPERLRKDSELMAYYAPRCPKGENEMHAWMVRTSKDLTAAIQRIEATAPLSATGATSDPFSMGPYVGDRSVKFLRQTFDAAADACDGDYPAKVNAGMLACYDSGRREGALLAAPTAPVVEAGAIRDASRYRWLNRQDNFLAYIEYPDGTKRHRLKCGEPLDKWIDAEIESERLSMKPSEGGK